MSLVLPAVLASSSPLRYDLLRAAGLDFKVAAAAGVEEIMDDSLSPPELTIHNARLKAHAVAGDYPDALVLAADTVVYLDGKPLGKPADLTDAARMLNKLSGRTHHVCTGVCLSSAGGMENREFHELTAVTFKPLTAAEIESYLAKVDVLDKAGAYAAQEHREIIIAGIEGSLSNVIGLPMERLLAELRRWEVTGEDDHRVN